LVISQTLTQSSMHARRDLLVLPNNIGNAGIFSAIWHFLWNSLPFDHRRSDLTVLQFLRALEIFLFD